MDNSSVFCTLDVGAIALPFEALTQLKADDVLQCSGMQLPFEGALRVNGTIWAYVSIQHSVEGGMTIAIKKLAHQA